MWQDFDVLYELVKCWNESVGFDFVQLVMLKLVDDDNDVELFEWKLKVVGNDYDVVG